MVLYLSNWSSHATHGHHGPGKKFTIMARPRSWEHGNGSVRILVPTGKDEELMTAALLERRGIPVEGWPATRVYRESLESLWSATIGDLSPGRLIAYQGLEDVVVASGDTLCCACSRPDAQAGRCHRTWAATFLKQAGWTVVLDGRKV
jgi:hypothetical protein